MRVGLKAASRDKRDSRTQGAPGHPSTPSTPFAPELSTPMRTSGTEPSSEVPSMRPLRTRIGGSFSDLNCHESPPRRLTRSGSAPRWLSKGRPPSVEKRPPVTAGMALPPSQLGSIRAWLHLASVVSLTTMRKERTPGVVRSRHHGRTQERSVELRITGVDSITWPTREHCACKTVSAPRNLDNVVPPSLLVRGWPWRNGARVGSRSAFGAKLMSAAAVAVVGAVAPTPALRAALLGAASRRRTQRTPLRTPIASFSQHSWLWLPLRTDQFSAFLTVSFGTGGCCRCALSRCWPPS